MPAIPGYDVISKGINTALKHCGMQKERLWPGAIAYLFMVVAIFIGTATFAINQVKTLIANPGQQSNQTTAPLVSQQANNNSSTTINQVANVNQETTYSWANAKTWSSDITSENKLDLKFVADNPLGIIPARVCVGVLTDTAAQRDVGGAFLTRAIAVPGDTYGAAKSGSDFDYAYCFSNPGIREQISIQYPNGARPKFVLARFVRSPQ